jgi:hypothetical protein
LVEKSVKKRWSKRKALSEDTDRGKESKRQRK